MVNFSTAENASSSSTATKVEVKEEEKPHPATSTTVHSNQQQPEIKNEKTQSHGVKGEGQSGQQLTTTSILTEDPNSTASSSVAPAAENFHRSGTPLEASVDSGSSSGDLLVVGSIGGGGDGGESGDGGDQVAAAADFSKKEKELKRPSFVVGVLTFLYLRSLGSNSFLFQLLPSTTGSTSAA